MHPQAYCPLRARLKFPPIISPPCAVKRSLFGEGFQVFHERGYKHRQLSSSWLVSRARSFGQKEALDQLTRIMAQLTEHSVDELTRFIRKTKVTPQFRRWYTISAPHVWNAAEAVSDRFPAYRTGYV